MSLRFILRCILQEKDCPFRYTVTPHEKSPVYEPDELVIEDGTITKYLAPIVGYVRRDIGPIWQGDFGPLCSES